MTLTKKILPLAALLAVAIPGGSALAAPKSKFRFSQPTYVTAEGAAPLQVVVTRSARHGHSRINQTSSVNWAITGGTATGGGTDYAVDVAQGTLTFWPGETQKVLTFTITQDSEIEPLESIQLKLTAATNNALITNPRTAQVLIADDDGPTQVQLVPSSQNVNEAAGNATFYAVRSGAATGATQVDYATSDGANVDDSFNAHAPADYASTSGTDLTFAAPSPSTPPDFSKTITVPIVDDSTIENPEDFNLTLSNLRGAVFPNNAPSVSATTTIVDNDSPPVFALDASSYDVNEDGSVDVTVQRLANPGAATAVSANDVFDVNWQTADGTATNPADYVPGADQTLEFDATDDAETITIAANDPNTQISLVDDSLAEGNETFGLSLPSASVEAGGDGIQPSIGAPSSATVTIHDNDVAAPSTAGGKPDGSATGGTTSTGQDTSGASTTATQGGDQLVLGARQAGCGLVVNATKKQRLLKQKGLKVKLRSGKACKVSIATTIRKVRASSRKKAQIVRALTFRGKKSSLTLQPGKAETVKVTFTKKTLKAITKALRARNKLVATVVVTTRDSASKVSRKTLKITIKR